MKKTLFFFFSLLFLLLLPACSSSKDVSLGVETELKLPIGSECKMDKDYVLVSGKTEGIMREEMIGYFEDNPLGFSLWGKNHEAVMNDPVKTGDTIEITGHSETKRTIIIIGDVTKDGKISSLDYVATYNHVKGEEKFKKDEECMLAADIDRNGKVNKTDISLIREMVLDSASSDE